MSETKRIYIICPVRLADEDTREHLERYAHKLERNGHEVWLPHRDTNQDASGMEICVENMQAINRSDEVHLFYDEMSQGIHFDLGIAFAQGKTLVVMKNGAGDHKSFPGMITEWGLVS